MNHLITRRSEVQILPAQLDFPNPPPGGQGKRTDRRPGCSVERSGRLPSGVMTSGETNRDRISRPRDRLCLEDAEHPLEVLGNDDAQDGHGLCALVEQQRLYFLPEPHGQRWLRPIARSTTERPRERKSSAPTSRTLMQWRSSTVLTGAWRAHYALHIPLSSARETRSACQSLARQSPTSIANEPASIQRSPVSVSGAPRTSRKMMRASRQVHAGVTQYISSLTKVRPFRRYRSCRAVGNAITHETRSPDTQPVQS